MKSLRILAVVLVAFAASSCVSRDGLTPEPSGPVRSSPSDPSDAGRLAVAQLMEVHQEYVGQLQGSAPLKRHPPAECN